MTKRTCQFPKHTCLREINFLKIAGISLLLFCTTSQIAVADSYEKNAVTATQQSKTEKITGKIVDESGQPHKQVDPYMKGRLQSKLMQAITKK